MANRGAVGDQVERKIQALRGIPFGPGSDRPLTMSEIGVDPAENAADSDHYLRILFGDIGDVVGADFLETLDPVLLEQYCVMTVQRNEPGGEVLRTLISAFMSAYAQPASSDQAMGILGSLVAIPTVSSRAGLYSA